MGIQKPNFREISTEDFLNFVFMLVTLFILSSVFWSDERDISGYYQNLIIASFSVAWGICLITFIPIRKARQKAKQLNIKRIRSRYGRW